MVFIQLHRGSCYLKVYLFWLNYVRASVTYDTKLHEDCLSNVYTLSSSAHIWWNSRDDRLTKKASMTRNFWNVKEGFKWSRGASFQVVKFQKKITSTLTSPPPPAASNSDPVSLLYSGFHEQWPRWWKAPSMLHFTSFQRPFARS